MLSQWPSSNSRPLSRHQLLENDLHLLKNDRHPHPRLHPSRQREQQPSPTATRGLFSKSIIFHKTTTTWRCKLGALYPPPRPRRRHPASSWSRRHPASSWMRRGNRRPGLPVYQSVTSVPCPPLVAQGTGPARCTECERYETLGGESGSTPAARLHNR